MADLAMLGIVIAFFAVSGALVELCERLR